MDKCNLLPITPAGLADELRYLVAKTCGCEGAWIQHPTCLTIEELQELRLTILEAINNRIEAMEAQLMDVPE